MPGEVESQGDGRGRIRVFGKNMFAGPLLDTSDAQTVIMYDDAGTPCVLLARMADNTWGMWTRRDSDWEAGWKRFGVE